MRQIPKNREDRDASQQTGECVQCGYDHCIAVDEIQIINNNNNSFGSQVICSWPKKKNHHLPINVMLKTIVRCVHNNRALSDAEREKHLHDRLLPHVCTEQKRPLGSQKENDSINGTLQRYGAPKNYDHH